MRSRGCDRTEGAGVLRKHGDVMGEQPESRQHLGGGLYGCGEKDEFHTRLRSVGSGRWLPGWPALTYRRRRCLKRLQNT